MNNSLVINFYREQIKKIFKNVKDNEKKIEYLENRIIILEEFIKKNIGEEEFKLLDIEINKIENLEKDPFILSIFQFLE